MEHLSVRGIHTDWRGTIRSITDDASLPVGYYGPVTHDPALRDHRTTLGAAVHRVCAFIYTPSMNDLVGVVLGAGSSRRLGRPKQTLDFGGQSLLSYVTHDIEAAESLTRIYLVLGGGSEEAQASLDLQRAQIVRNDSYGTGCASSLLAGLDAAGACDAIVMLLGDMPGVSADVIDSVMNAWRDNPTWAAVTEYRGELGHPFVFSAAAFDQLRGLHGDKAVWKIVDNEPVTRVARIAVDRDLPRDIDTWDDYDDVCAQFGFATGQHDRGT
jgi:molybdenum cofactor cytidylyltransferase